MTTQEFKSMNVSLENYQRLQRCGFGGESMNDVIRRVLSIVEPQIETQLQRSETFHQTSAAAAATTKHQQQEDCQKRVAEEQQQQQQLSKQQQEAREQ